MAGNLPRHTSQSNSGPARFTKSTAGAQKVSGNQTADNIQTPSKPGWHLQVEAHFKKKASGVIELLEELGIEEMADLSMVQQDDIDGSELRPIVRRKLAKWLESLHLEY